MNRWSRRLHRWGGILIAIPLLLVIATGLILQFKKEFAWIQPKTLSGSPNQMTIGWPKVLESAMGDEDARINSWADVDRLDVRPAKGVIKVRAKNGWEVQLDSATGEILSSAYRRSDFIESLHDGSYFSDFVKLYVFSANGMILLGLWISGIYLWFLPIQAKRKKKRRLAKKAQP
ncbi:PepSY-associated TM helix domain-containing protein [Mariniblastus fucicola]|uniref:PepSY-associated TM helix n=1 Tax=Mariniblastus fucicola TaxID=980251 RepID=A0A5B9P7X4_9BACT|nr:PepSY-associated TM helix domain-containing protein [Mariniblastus fucicola]QEG22414.1 hypothetical protein MFFC18_22940 [Mariniblastus fucicola]